MKKVVFRYPNVSPLPRLASIMNKSLSLYSSTDSRNSCSMLSNDEEEEDEDEGDEENRHQEEEDEDDDQG